VICSPHADPVLGRIITQALADARSAGLDHVGQTQRAVTAVLVVRPDMTASAG